MIYATVVASICMILYFIFIPHKNAFYDLLFKTLSSLCFLLCALLFLQKGQDHSYMNIMMIGLFLGACGDVFLALPFCYPNKKDIFFLLGLGSFLFGHFAYALALYQSDTLYLSISIMLSIIIGVVMILLLKKTGVRFEKMLIPSMIYAMVIMFMEMQALHYLLLEINLYAIWLNIGTLCFVLSDLVLVFILFKDMNTKEMTRLNLTLYYFAQMSLVFTFLMR